MKKTIWLRGVCLGLTMTTIASVVGIATFALTQAPAFAGTSPTISDFAGNYTQCSPSGSAPYCGDTGSATSAQFNGPTGTAVDAQGDVFIVDHLDNVVRMVPKTSGTYFGQAMTGGDIYTIAGNYTQCSPSGSAPYCGDTGLATSAQLNGPTYVTLDPSGNLYISDGGSDGVIRMVPRSSGTYFGQSMTADHIYKVAGDYTTQSIKYPEGLAYDSAAGSLYIADNGNETIDLLQSNGTLIHVVGTYGTGCTQAPSPTTCGNNVPAGSAYLWGPTGIALDAEGDLFIADSFDDEVRMVPLASGTYYGQTMTADYIYDIAGSYAPCTNLGSCGDGGIATSATLSDPQGLVVDSTTPSAPVPNVYIADSNDQEVRVVVGSTPPPGMSSTTQGYIYPIAGTYTKCVLSNYVSAPYCGDGSSPPTTTGVDFQYPHGLAINSSGDLYIADQNDNAERVVSNETNGSVTPYPEPLQGGAPKVQELPAVNQAEPCIASSATLDPVDTNTGAFEYQKTLISIPNHDLPLRIVVSYNSGLAQLGNPTPYQSLNGWNAETTAKLVTNDDYGTSSTGWVTIIQSDGSEVAFQPGTTSNGVTTFPPAAPRIQATLTLNTSSGVYTYVVASTKTYTYNSSGQLQKITDLNGNYINYNYTSGSLTSISDEAGRSISFSGLTMTDSAGRSVTFGFNSSGNITSVTDATGAVTSFGYGSNNEITSVTTPDNQGANPAANTTNTYYSSGAYTGQIESQSDPMGRTTQFSYSGSPSSSSGGSTVVTYGNLNETKYNYVNGELASVTKGYGSSSPSTTSYTYNPTCGAVATKTDPNGNVSSYTYDSNANLLTSTNGALDTTTYTYATGALPNEPATVTDPSGNVTSYSYNSAGEMTSKILGYGTPQAATWTYGYDSAGDLTSIIDPNEQSGAPDAGSSTTYGYNTYGERTSMVTPSGTTTYSYSCSSGCYNNVGLLYSEVSPLGNVSGATPSNFTTSYTYDADGRMLTKTYPPAIPGTTPPATTTYVYDGDGNLTQTTSRNGYVTKNIYNADDELTSQTKGYGSTSASTMSYGYDNNGNVVTVQDGMLDTTTYTYNALNQVVEVGLAGGQDTYYGYDLAGNLICTTEPNSASDTCANASNPYEISRSYDQANRLTSITYGDGTPSVTYSYYQNGLRKTMTDGVGSGNHTTTYSYNSLDKLTSVTDENGNTVSYGYDPSSNVTCIAYPIPGIANSNCGTGPSSTNSVVDYTYNASGQMATMTDWLGQTWNFTYDANGNLTTDTYPTASQMSITYAYDNTNTLTQLSFSDPTVSSNPIVATYPRNAGEQLNGGSPGYTGYNGQGQMTQNYLTNYGYNSDGSLNCLTTYNTSGYSCTNPNSSVTTTLGYNSNDQVTSQTPAASGTPTSYSYNSMGERIGSTTGTASTSYQWNLASNMCWYSATASNSSCASPPTGATTYSYNGDGLRMSETVGTTTSNFVWNSNTSTPQIIEDSTNAYIYGPSNFGGGTAPLEQISLSSGTASYLVTNLVGVGGVTSTTGSIIATKSYSAYGTVSGSSSSTPFGYEGSYTDPNGLVYMIHRYYDPSTAQFLSVDPLVNATHTPYSYANDDPFDVTDPSGLCGCQWLQNGALYLTIIGAFAGASAGVGGAGVLLSIPLIEVYGNILLIAGFGLLILGASLLAVSSTCSS